MKKLRPSTLPLFSPTAGVLLLLVGALPEACRAQSYLGANAVLHQVEERNAKPVEKPAKADEQTQLRDDLKAFSQSATNLPPAEAATRWLALVDRAITNQQQSARSYNQSVVPIQAEDVLAALPPPAAWNELAQAIAARPAVKGGAEIQENGLRLLAATLTGNIEERKREIAWLQTKAKTGSAQTTYYYQSLLEQISQAMLATSNDPDAILKSLERQLAPGGRRGYQRNQALTVPNLVSQVGAEKAGAFLRKALVAPDVTLQFKAASETSRLAQKLALELMPQLKSPQWGLVNSLDASALYEALDKRFGAMTNAPEPATESLDVIPDVPLPANDYSLKMQKAVAQIYYLLGLISQDRAKDAVAVAKKINSQESYLSAEPFKAMERAGYTTAMDNFFHELLSEDPTLPFWNEYVEIAAKSGQTARMLELVRAAAARTDLSASKKAAIQQTLFKALLAADAVDEGVAEMRRLIASDVKPPARSYNFDSYNAGQLGIMTAQIGMLLQKPEWTKEGVSAAKKWLEQTTAENPSDYTAQSVVHSLAEMLIKLNQGTNAESILTDALATATRKGSTRPDYDDGNGAARGILGELAVLYHKAGRPDDVLVLLQQSADWGAKDLSDLFDSSGSDGMVSLMSLHAGSDALPLPYLAASALIAKGSKPPAEKIVAALLNQDPGLDRGYELLLALEGTNAIPRLDALFARDQFEERPLIWKAHLLRQQNQLEAAEKAVRQAIAIDPSDGEEGRGDRMRAYAELADIREARGDKKEAGFFREVVQAIRLSEEADQFYAAGLLKRAIPMYEAALKHFSDAYCIQSRLAIQLSALGLNEEAEEHYRRAYELMPDSFGRVESHCFGCEKAFEGEHAQSIAEKVFTKLAEERPDKPQIHYLLGYLREEQERYNEALTNYLTAVRLDPDYLNAWVRISGISENVLMPPKERDEIVFNILRLDPLQRHDRPRFDRLSDLAGLWNAVDAAARHQPAPPSDLLALTASKAAMEKKEKSSDEQSVQMQMQRMQAGNNTLSPSRAIGETPFVRLAGQMVLSGNSGLLDE